jgi:DNA gyrase subunit B
MSKEYGNESMSALIGPEPVRKRPETVLGSKGLAGAQHTIIEMIGNALDEATAGYGDRVEVHYFGNGAISVRDYGRGIPLGWNPDVLNTDNTKGDWQWHMVYERMYAGGKYGDEDNQEALKNVPEDAWEKMTYDNYQEYLSNLGVTYLFSIGLNGLGAYATCASSRYLLVKSYRDGKCSEMHFTEGVHDYEELKIYDTDEPNGTYVEWQPDDRVFTSVDITSSWVRSVVEGFSVSSNIDMVFIDENNEETVYPAATVKTEMEQKHDSISYSEDFTKSVEDNNIALMASQVALSEGSSSTIYVNNVLSYGGAPADAFNDSITMFMSKYGESTGRKLRYDDYANLISYAIAIKVNVKSLRGQTKDSIDNKYIYTGLRDIISNMLSSAYSSGEPWLKSVLDNVSKHYDERIAFEEMAAKSKEISKAIKSKQQPLKFMSSVSYTKGDAAHTELWLIEGDSASGSIAHARNADTQAVFPLRGKTKNIYKADPAKALQTNGKSSNKVAELLQILDCGTVLDGSFDQSRCKVNDIIVLSDADKDGYHIRMLVFIMLLKYCPQLIYTGHFYVCKAPLYDITFSNGNKGAAWSQDELDNYRSQDPNLVFEYFKGIGQMEPEEVSEYCMSPKTRHLQKIDVSENDPALAEALEFLFGTSVSARKERLLRDLMGDEEYEDSVVNIKKSMEIIDSLDIDNELEEVEV